MPVEDKISVIIFDGGSLQGEVEELMTKGRHAALLDTINKMKKVEYFQEFYLVTNFPQLAARARPLGVKVYLNSLAPADFHFGRALKELINSEGLHRVFCMGGGSIPLASMEELAALGRIICEEKESAVFSNNVQSGDFTAFVPAKAINNIPLPRQDNALATLLREEAGLAMKLFPNLPGLTFDLDTPTDLLVLGSSSKVGSHTIACLKELNLDFSRINAAKKVLRGDYQEVFLLGRVGAPVIAYINQNLKVRLRVLSEERGMKALGRQQRGEVVSLAGCLVEELGPERFVQQLSRTAQCVFWDTRVLFAHFGLNLPDEERFSSDLGLWQKVKHPLVRRLTRAVVESPVPIICGGHSLVSGSLQVLVDEIGPQHPFHFSVVR